MLLMQRSIFSADDSGYAVENYDESPGYFGSKGQAYFYSEEWKTVVLVNMR
jgi:hypothetical protein